MSEDTEIWRVWQRELLFNSCYKNIFREALDNSIDKIMVNAEVNSNIWYMDNTVLPVDGSDVVYSS